MNNWAAWWAAQMAALLVFRSGNWYLAAPKAVSSAKNWAEWMVSLLADSLACAWAANLACMKDELKAECLVQNSVDCLDEPLAAQSVYQKVAWSAQ